MKVLIETVDIKCREIQVIIKTDYCRQNLGKFQLLEVPKFDNSRLKYSQLRLIGTPVNRENRLIGTNLQERNHLHRS